MTIQRIFQTVYKNNPPDAKNIKKEQKRKLKVYKKDPEIISTHFLMHVWKMFDQLTFEAFVSQSGGQLLNYLCNNL